MNGEGYDTEMLIDDEHERVDSDIIVYDTLATAVGRVRKIVFVTKLAIRSGDGGVIDSGSDHKVEAIKVFDFLRQWISCRSYNIIYRMMVKSDRTDYYHLMDELNCVADSYECNYNVYELERTILVLESVRKLYVEGVCAGCMPEAVRTMVDNEIDLLRNKVDSIVTEEGDKS